MRALYLFLFLLFLALCLPSIGQAQGTLTLGTNPVEIRGIDSVTLQIPTDIDTFQYTDIVLFLRGGDGGRASRDSRTGQGGHGAEVSVRFPIGRGAGALRPGGRIRFAVGDDGENATGSSTAGGAGGGGGSGILYKDPGVAHTGGSMPTTNLENSVNFGWTLLAVAGGGGGGYVDANDRSSGKPGTNTTAGSNGQSTGGNNNAGGSNGAAGTDQSNDGAGAGCGFRTINQAGNNGYNGVAGGINGRKVDDFANRSGGFGYSPGGHGRRDGGGGGGGGYSGGGSGRNSGSGGGGGGSFASSSSTATTITQRSNSSSPDPGFISYYFIEDLTPGPAPDALCKGAITIVLNDGEGTTITGEELDNGSTNPLDEELNYLIALNAIGDEFAYFDDRTFDCDDIGVNNNWFLAAANSADTTLCATQTTITVELGTVTIPTCPIDREVDLNTGCVGTVPLSHIRPISTGDCSDLDISLSLPNAQVVNNPLDFFEGGYEFIAGTTVITYANSVGSCSFNIILNAGSIPNLSCPSDRDFDARFGECGREVQDGFTNLDNVGIGVTYRLTNEAIDFVPVTGTGNIGEYYFPRGITTVEYFKEDAGGCVSNCSFEITMDGNPEDFPEIECADEIMVEFSPGLDIEDFLPQGVLSVSDDCGIKELTFNIPNVDCNRIGRRQSVDVEVMDIDGNPALHCSFDLILTETTPPLIRCKDPFTVSLNNSNGRVTLRADDVDEGTMADCDFDLSLEGATNSTVVFDCSDLGENTVTLIATNEEGNQATASCTTIVTVIDDRVPNPICQNTILILSEIGEAFLAPTNLDGGSTDNCTIVDFTASKTAFTCDDIGDNAVRLTLTDQSGNSNSCTSIVTIQDSPNAYCAVLLPVELTSFSGKTIGKRNQLNWTVANEEGFSHFVVERLNQQGADWQELGAVAGAWQGQESSVAYTFDDATPLTDNYYRLKMIDMDGSYSYSHIVQLAGPSNASFLYVFPNPSNGYFEVAIPEHEGLLHLALYTVHGTRVRASQIVSGTRKWTMQHALMPGVYLVVVSAPEGQRWTQWVVVR